MPILRVLEQIPANTNRFKKIPPITSNSPRRSNQFSPYSNVESENDDAKSTYQTDYKKTGVDLCMSKAYRILSNNNKSIENNINKPLISIKE